MHVGGAGGTGKSELISCISTFVKEHYGVTGSSYGPVLIVSPTGIAAFNMKGHTID